MIDKIEFKLFKVKTEKGESIRATHSPYTPYNTRLYSSCGDTWREALHSVVDLLLEEDIIVCGEQRK